MYPARVTKVFNLFIKSCLGAYYDITSGLDSGKTCRFWYHMVKTLASHGFFTLTESFDGVAKKSLIGQIFPCTKI